MSSNDAGLMSSAGLVRYFDSDSNQALQLDPKSVLAFAIFLGVVVEVVKFVV